MMKEKIGGIALASGGLAGLLSLECFSVDVKEDTAGAGEIEI